MHLWPQYTLLALVLIGVGVSMARYGEPKRDTYGIYEAFIGPSILLGLLYAGGFFGGM